MDRRFLLFIALSFGIIMTWSVFRIQFGPPPKIPLKNEPLKNEQELATAPSQGAVEDVTGVPDESPLNTPDSPPESETEGGDSAAKIKSTVANATWASLGSIDPATGYQMLVTFASRGAAIERVELSSPRYLDLNNVHGYLGNLAFDQVDSDSICRIGVVGRGTPAAKATLTEGGSEAGLLPGDIVVGFQNQPIDTSASLNAALQKTSPGQSVEIQVNRQGQELTFTTSLVRKPLEVIYPELEVGSTPGAVPLGSYTLTLESVGLGSKAKTIPIGAAEIPQLPSLRTGHWELVTATDELVEYRFRVGESDLAKLDKQGALEIRKRFRLWPANPDATDISAAAYHINLEIEIVSLTDGPIQAAYRLDGPHGLPLEGWWYATKISPGWGGAGARDVVWRSERGVYQLLSAAALHKVAIDKKDGALWKPLFTDDDKEDLRTVRFIGVDTQYFSSILMPGSDNPESAVFRRGFAKGIGDASKLDKARNKAFDVSFHLSSESVAITREQPLTQSFIVFAGPKDPAVLARYQVGELIEYGWWAWVSFVLGKLLSMFYWVTGNFGISVIMLTIVVRTCMLPISFKMTKNAQRMQALAPEMKVISEKFKNDLEKKNKAIQELWKKHNVNPLSGCFLVFFQLPVFAGLYRLLATDITLRQSPLLHGMQWCSNLAGPDEFCRWPAFLPEMLIGETGWLGPYLNVLPLVTIALFIMNQRLLTPPPTDDQQKMQQQIMTFMMIFFAVMFFKVPSGLCLYFIASSLWTLAEHKVLKKNKLAPARS